MTERSPDHSTLSRTRRLIDVETHAAVFTWVLERLAEAGLVAGKTVGIDATTLEANAAMRSIERRDTGETPSSSRSSRPGLAAISTPCSTSSCSSETVFVLRRHEFLKVSCGAGSHVTMSDPHY